MLSVNQFSPQKFRRSAFKLALLSLAMSVGVLYGQGNSDQVRGLNNEVLRLHGQFRNTPRGQEGSLRQQAANALVRRSAALRDLMQNDPREALKLGFSPDVLMSLAQAFPESAGNLESQGVWEGPAEYLVLDDMSRRSSKDVIKMSVGQQKLNVHFGGKIPDGLKCGAVLRVEGMQLSTEIAALGGTVNGSTAAAASPGCSTTGVQNIAVLLVQFPGVPSPVSASDVSNVFFGTGGHSLAGYWQEASYGKASATGSVFGPYTLPASYTCDQYDQILASAIQAADADVNFPNYNRVFVSFPLTGSCAWAGISNVGCVSITSADGTSTASTTWLISNYLSPADQGVEIVAHEGGHALTLGHAQSRGFVPDAVGTLGASGTLSEYGDSFDAMGYYTLGHYGAQHKNQLGWLNSSNVLTVQGAGTYALAPLSLNTGSLQALQVHRGTGNNAWLWIEYHQPVGNYDSALSAQIFSGATVRYQDSQTVSGKTNLLDFTPASGSWLDPALAAGNTWTDPYSNVSLNVQSATSSALTLGVNYGATPCTPGNPLVTISPLNPSVASGASVNYSITVKNTDSTGCGSSTLNLSSTQPAGWQGVLSSWSVGLSPGQSTSVTLTESVPTGTAPGTYPVASGAAKGSVTANASANATVMTPPPPPPPLSASLTLSGSSYKVKSNVPLTAQVLSGTSPGDGASVVFTLNRASGGPVTQTVTANSAGTAVWNYKPVQKGSYSVSATAKLNSATATSNTIIFQAQ